MWSNFVTPPTCTLPIPDSSSADTCCCLQWASLVQKLTNTYPNAATKVLLDILNEPDSQYLSWNWGNRGSLSASQLYLKGMDAIAAGNPCAPLSLR